MGPILQFLARYGYRAGTILRHLSRSNPKLYNQINTAIGVGYPAVSILNSLARNKKGTKEDKKAELDFNTAWNRSRKSIDERNKRTEKKALGALGTAAALYAMSGQTNNRPPHNPYANRGQPQQAAPLQIGFGGGQPQNQQPAPNAPQQPPPNAPPITPATPQTPQTRNPTQPLPENIPPLPTTITPVQVQQAVQQNPLDQAQQTNQNIPTANTEKTAFLNKAELLKRATSPQALQPSPEMQAEEPEEPPAIKAARKLFVENPQLEKFINKHREVGKKDEEIYEALQKAKLFKPIIDRFETTTGRHFLGMMKGLKPNAPIRKNKVSFPSVRNLEKKYKISKELAEDVRSGKVAPVIARALENKDVVMTPDGSGEVQTVHGDDAYVKIDGKLKKVPVSEIEEPDENVLETVDRLLGLTEKDKSAPIYYWAYNPEAKRAMFIFNQTREAYEYNDLSEEIASLIENKAIKPKTTGENEFGAWSPEDEESLGASVYKLIISDPKYKKPKKGEPPNPFYRKLDKKYDRHAGLSGKAIKERAKNG